MRRRRGDGSSEPRGVVDQPQGKRFVRGDEPVIESSLRRVLDQGQRSQYGCGAIWYPLPQPPGRLLKAGAKQPGVGASVWPRLPRARR